MQTQWGPLHEKIQAQYGAPPVKSREIKKELGKEDFLKMMMVQLQHQDPTNPMKPEDMLSKMATLATVEGIQNMGKQLGELKHQNRPMEQMAMTHLIGKTLTVDRQRFFHREKQPTYVGFQLSRPAEEVKLSLLDERGEVILSKQLGPQPAGAVGWSWDGLLESGIVAKTGQYQFRVTAQDVSHQDIPVESTAKLPVIGVSFESSEPVFLVGQPEKPEKMFLKNILKIEQ